MGRVQSFATDDAVRAARSVFWEQGYDNASLPDLERATGLSRSSIYHAFTSKRGLFDAAVQNYLDEIIRPRLRPLQAERVETGAIETYFTGLRAALARRGTPASDNGCLLINAAGSPIAQDAAVSSVISGYRADLELALGRGVAARAPGLPAAEHDRLARVLTSLVIAAMTLVRIDPAESLITLDAAIQLLPESPLPA
jgi:AcrR family transcriptional regulator